jgi:hypothetical protein
MLMQFTLSFAFVNYSLFFKLTIEQVYFRYFCCNYYRIDYVYFLFILCLRYFFVFLFYYVFLKKETRKALIKEWTMGLSYDRCFAFTHAQKLFMFVMYAKVGQKCNYAQILRCCCFSSRSHQIFISKKSSK